MINYPLEPAVIVAWVTIGKFPDIQFRHTTDDG